MYRLLLHRNVAKQLAKIPRDYAQRLANEMRALQQNPRPEQSIPLESELRRLRIGAYRIVYAAFDEEQTVVVLKVERRGEDTYRDLDALLVRARQLLETGE